MATINTTGGEEHGPAATTLDSFPVNPATTSPSSTQQEKKKELFTIYPNEPLLALLNIPSPERSKNGFIMFYKHERMCTLISSHSLLDFSLPGILLRL